MTSRNTRRHQTPSEAGSAGLTPVPRQSSISVESISPETDVVSGESPRHPATTADRHEGDRQQESRCRTPPIIGAQKARFLVQFQRIEDALGLAASVYQINTLVAKQYSKNERATQVVLLDVALSWIVRSDVVRDEHFLLRPGSEQEALIRAPEKNDQRLSPSSPAPEDASSPSRPSVRYAF